MAIYAIGGVLGGFIGATFVIIITLALKAGIDVVAAQPPWLIVTVPLGGLAIASLVLQGIGRSETAGARARGARAWITFKRGAVRADITDDVVTTAGEEERFPWRLAPIRAIAVFATVGLGGPMGTEAPAVYFGVAAGAWLGDRGRRWRRLLRPAALGGGAAGVAALMGIPLVGTAYILEIDSRHTPLTAERLVAAVMGGIVGWGIDVVFHLSLIRLVVPKQPPDNFVHAVFAAVFIGALSGAVTALMGKAIYRGKRWKASPVLRLVVGGLATGAIAIALSMIAAPSAASGPGTGAILWAEQTSALPSRLLGVSLLRGAATVATASAGGCGGIFVPFLAVGDLSGRVVASGLGVGHDLAGAAGAAGGISGGYRLPFTAMAMVLGCGGPQLATLTCLATVAMAFLAGEAVDSLLHGFKRLPHFWRRAQAH
jgi:H+/Cl- antiporter ClcA